MVSKSNLTNLLALSDHFLTKVHGVKVFFQLFFFSSFSHFCAFLFEHRRRSVFEKYPRWIAINGGWDIWPLPSIKSFFPLIFYDSTIMAIYRILLIFS